VNPNTYFVPNAADIRHSQKALDPALPVSALIKDIPKPVIGYFGNIERRMDYEMLEKVVALNPDKSFVFVGPQDRGYIPDWFFNTPNVFSTGSVPYSEMPAVIKGFDVALLPFKRDEVSATIFPLKLFEYLGAGKPLVAINFNDDLKEFTGDTVAYCGDAATFSAAIGNALLDKDPVKMQERINVAAANTWENRVEQIATLLADALERKSRR
jgi:teichuronic acid biosynthesis glycosyltransferase TuaH